MRSTGFPPDIAAHGPVSLELNSWSLIHIYIYIGIINGSGLWLSLCLIVLFLFLLFFWSLGCLLTGTENGLLHGLKLFGAYSHSHFFQKI